MQKNGRVENGHVENGHVKEQTGRKIDMQKNKHV